MPSKSDAGVVQRGEGWGGRRGPRSGCEMWLVGCESADAVDAHGVAGRGVVFEGPAPLPSAAASGGRRGRYECWRGGCCRNPPLRGGLRPAVGVVVLVVHHSSIEKLRRWSSR